MIFRVEINKDELKKYCEGFDPETKKWTDVMQFEIALTLAQFAESYLEMKKHMLINEALMDWDI